MVVESGKQSRAQTETGMGSSFSQVDFTMRCVLGEVELALLRQPPTTELGE